MRTCWRNLSNQFCTGGEHLKVKKFVYISEMKICLHSATILRILLRSSTSSLMKIPEKREKLKETFNRWQAFARYCSHYALLLLTCPQSFAVWMKCNRSVTRVNNLYETIKFASGIGMASVALYDNQDLGLHSHKKWQSFYILEKIDSTPRDK